MKNTKTNTFIHRVLFIFLVAILVGCSKNNFKDKWTRKQAPATFKARFETSKGNFEIMANRNWSPKGVDRLYQLITSNFFTDIALFRVVPDFVVQFGIHNDSTLNKNWKRYTVPDEKVMAINQPGTIAFARSGKNTRSTQLFINLGDNSPRLDTIHYSGVTGFPVVAKVIKGMEVVKDFYDGYKEAPAKQQDSIQKLGNMFLQKHYPKLDYIKKVYIVR